MLKRNKKLGELLLIPLLVNIVSGFVQSYIAKPDCISVWTVSLTASIFSFIIVVILWIDIKSVWKRCLSLAVTTSITLIIAYFGYDWYGITLNRILTDRLQFSKAELEVLKCTVNEDPQRISTIILVHYKLHSPKEVLFQPLYACIGIIDNNDGLYRRIYIYMSKEIKGKEIKSGSGIIKFNVRHIFPRNRLCIVLLNKPREERAINLMTDRYPLYQELGDLVMDGGIT